MIKPINHSPPPFRSCSALILLHTFTITKHTPTKKINVIINVLAISNFAYFAQNRGNISRNYSAHIRSEQSKQTRTLIASSQIDVVFNVEVDVVQCVVWKNASLLHTKVMTGLMLCWEFLFCVFVTHFMNFQPSPSASALSFSTFTSSTNRLEIAYCS